MPEERIQSLDHLRGFAVVGMIVVGILGHFTVFPEYFRHHLHGFSFTESIAPLFVFMAGMGLRISLSAKTQICGLSTAQKILAYRFFLIILIGVFCYGIETYVFNFGNLQAFYRKFLLAGLWGPLVCIGYAGILSIPFAHRGTRTRIIAALGFVIIFQAISDLTPYAYWLQTNKGEGGGPLGGFSWAFIFILGTLAADYVRQKEKHHIPLKILGSGVIMLAVGMLLSPQWPISKPLANVSFAVTAAGWSFIYLLCFYYLADIRRVNIPHLVVFGRNALMTYLFQGTLLAILFGFFHISRTAPFYVAALLLAGVYTFSYAFALLCAKYEWRFI